MSKTERASNNQDFYSSRAREFVELHDQVQTSVTLLDSLEAFLSTFQKDLSAVSGQISELQDRSKDIEGRLKSRRKIEKPLSNLITDITIPPSLATIILDTNVGEPWINAIDDFERRLDTSKSRTRVKAARDLGEVAEGLRIVAASKLRLFFLGLFQPIRTNVTTNMQVIQTSVLIKYRPMFAFLERQAPNVAHEVQRSYIGAARVYFETGFRRYARSLGAIKARTTEKFEPITSGGSELDGEIGADLARLQYARIEGPSVTLAFMADNKAHKEPPEALLRSLMLVLLDNATAEYTFITAFFTPEPDMPAPTPAAPPTPLFSPTGLLSPNHKGEFGERQSNHGSEFGGSGMRQGGRHYRANSITSDAGQIQRQQRVAAASRAEQAHSDSIWKQVMEPVLEYCQTFVKSLLEPTPQATTLLTMIRITEDVMMEVQKRSCPPLETFIFGLRIQMWPIFQKVMTENVDALKKLAEGSSAGYFGRGASTTDASVIRICQRYDILFNSFVTLTSHEDETMIFSNLLRLRQELTKVIVKHTDRISDTVAKATMQSTIYETLLQGLSKGSHITTHPKAQQEIAYWAGKEEEARRRIVSVGKTRAK